MIFSREVNFYGQKSQEEVWNELEMKMYPDLPSRTVRFSLTRLSVAAGFLLIIGLTALLRFYSVSSQQFPWFITSVVLPDSSKAELNANSTLTYYPFWWKIHRILRLDGEAFFEVEKGNKFTVHSGPGKIEVLGTRLMFCERRYFESHLSHRQSQGRFRYKGRSIVTPNSSVRLKSNGDIEV